jgi:hypothetical protein
MGWTFVVRGFEGSITERRLGIFPFFTAFRTTLGPSLLSNGYRGSFRGDETARA